MEVHNFTELQSSSCIIFQAIPTNYHLENMPDPSKEQKNCAVFFYTVHFLVCISMDAVVGM